MKLHSIINEEEYKELYAYAADIKDIRDGLKMRREHIKPKNLIKRMTEIDEADVRIEDFKPIKVNKVKIERTAGWWAFSRYSINKYSM